MAEWRKVLVSGSNAHIAAITASAMGDLTNDAEVVFRKSGASNGTFHSSGSNFNVKFTSSDGGQLYLDNIGLTTYNISASGLPNSIVNNSQVVFWNSDNGGLQATSSLYFEDNNLVFDGGIFSGSFTGDGSGLVGVVGTLPFPLKNGNGIISSSGGNFDWTGSQEVTVQVNLLNAGGLTFEGGGLRLTESLAGAGLYFPSGANDYNMLAIDLAPNSGLSTGSGQASDKLSINSNIAGDGITFTEGVLTASVATAGGIDLVGTAGNKELKLVNTLPGTGLVWGDSDVGADRTVIDVDTAYVVTNTNTITFKTGSTNLTLSATNASTTPGGFVANLIDNPQFTYDLNNTLTGDFTFEGDVIVEGSLTVSGTFVSASFETENVNIKDRLILVNSGSDTGDGGFMVQTGVGDAAFMFYDSESARWGVSNKFKDSSDTTANILDVGSAAIVTVQVTNSIENDIITFTPLFGTSGGTRSGQLIVTTVPDTNESSLFIYA
jgi:hypothetical protein